MLDPLPEKQTKGADVSRGTIIKTPSGLSSASTDSSVQKIDLNANLFEIKKLELRGQIIELEEKKMKLDIENERLRFQKQQA